MFIQLKEWYAGIWGEIVDLYPSSVVMCAHHDSRQPYITQFYDLRPRIVELPPDDSWLIFMLFDGKVIRLESDPKQTALEKARLCLIERIMSA
jgi:hypothetical protein